MKALIQATPAYALSVEINTTTHEHQFKLVSYVPTARRPEKQTKFSGLFSSDELRVLGDLIQRTLDGAEGSPTTQQATDSPTVPESSSEEMTVLTPEMSEAYKRPSEVLKQQREN
jgi:hypothetical protein